MSEVIIISAIGKNNEIGYKGEIPWYISGDFQHFKRTTDGCPCLMGDITYQTLPDNARPLPGRENIILTLNKDYENPDNVTVMHDLNEAITYAKTKSDKVFICGGGTIYRIAMPLADKLIITRVHKTFEADTFFPEIKEDEWTLAEESEKYHDEKSGLDYTFQVYVRK
ncbi:dihydrofolate reductase [Bacteroidota bacterium]